MTTHAADSQARGTRADARRRHLLDVARSLFIEQGFHQTGIAQIALASEIKVGQIYRDFESKEAIIAAICEIDVTTWLEEDVLARAVASGDLTAIRAWLTRFGDRKDAAKCRMMTEILAEAGRNANVAEIYRMLDGRVRASLSAALRAVAPKGVGADAIDYLAELILTLGAGTACRWVVHGDTAGKTAHCILNRVLNHELDTLARAADGPA